MKLKNTLSRRELYLIDAYFRAANYVSVGELYLLDNPLLRRPLELSDVKSKLVGHWGTVPGQNFIYVHLNRVIKKYDLDMIYISGPGHGGNSVVANTYLEGSYSEIYPSITYDEKGLQKLMKQFSFPGGVSSHAAPETPGSIHEGGELGYSLSHAFGAILDNPTLIAACVIGDGEAETGPLATSWQLNKFINPKHDGAVLPILHLNGYKIANPTVLARIPKSELTMYLKGCGWDPIFVSGSDPMKMHEAMATAMDEVISRILEIQEEARSGKEVSSTYHWPMIVLRTPKGWTGPEEVDGLPIEGTFRAHQIPLIIDEDHKDNLHLLEEWLRSYHPEELFDENGTLYREIREMAPDKRHCMGLNRHANGGLLLKPLIVPDFKKYGVDVPKPGTVTASDTRVLSSYVRDVIVKNPRNFRVFGPDEALSNRLNDMFQKTSRQWEAPILPTDEYLAPAGRVMDSYLSEHVCEGALEGYLLTGRYGFFDSYEAFARIVDSMASQHAKWLKVTKELSWRKPIASLNFLLTSHVWQQDHNGYTHQDPGFLNHLVTKKADIVRMYLPPDANCLLSCFDHCIQSKNYINVIVASKHLSYQWLSMNEAVKHCKKGIGIWKFASNDEGKPDIVMACCGDTPTLETLAAVTILRRNYPNLKVRVVNVVDLMKLESDISHPHGLSDDEWEELFPLKVPVIFAFHGYPSLIHQLIYKRKNDQNFHVHGYKEEGTITTAFDMRVQNHLDRYHLVMDALRYLPKLKNVDSLVSYCNLKLFEHSNYIRKYGKDLPDVTNWSFPEAMKNLES